MRLIVLLLLSSSLFAQHRDRFPGFRVYEGDMLMPNSAITSQLPARLWTNNTVPYVLDPDIPNPARIMNAITWYNQNTPVTYQPRANEANFLHYMRSTVGDGVCYSSVGMVGGEQFIHVEDTCNTATLIHEMTHTTGFFHEQERHDRNQNITVLYENIDKAQFGEFPLSGTSGQDVGAYEYASLMHYSAFEFSRTGLPVMETVPAGIPFDTYNVLSPGDLDTLFRMYGKPPTQTTVVTNPPGLQMTVDGASVTSPQVYNWTPGSTHTVAVATQTTANGRYSFGKWSDGGDASHTVTSSPATTIYTANFVQQVHVATSATPTAGGSVSINSPSPDGYYARQTTLVLTATPASGYTFLRWSGGGGLTCPRGDAQNPLTVNTGGANLDCIATFTQSPITTIASDPPGMSITVDGTNVLAPVSMVWTPNSTHTIATQSPTSTAVSPTRYIFQGWSDGKAASHSVTSGSTPTTVTASFKTQYLLVLPSTSPANGTVTVTPSSSDNFYDAGTVLTISATPASGRVATPWTSDLFGQPNPAMLTMNSQMSFGVTFPTAASQAALTLVNAADFRTNTVSPGELVTIFGLGIGPVQLVGAALDANNKFPTSLAGTTVTFGSVNAPIIYTSSSQVAAIVPYELASSKTTAWSVSYNGKRIAGPTLTVDVSAPGIFTFNSSGVGPAVIANQDGTINSPDHPAPKGSVIVLYATGEGQISPGGVDGALTGTPLPSLTQPASLRIGGKPAVLQYAGEAPGEVSGVMQINAVVPMDATSGMVSLYLVIGTNASPINVWMYVQ
jgi:uncharacterized protein (TIGR03437 family)